MEHHEPFSLATAVRRIQRQELLLPNIQRNFVWSPRQICALFDSLMRGYPIGNVLLWKVRPQRSANLGFIPLVTNFDGEQKAAKKINVAAHRTVTAVLDGQQRLTAVNLGLAGSYRGSSTAPERALWLDLTRVEPDAPTDALMYRFDMLTENEDPSAGESLWFKASEILGMRTPAQVDHYLAELGLGVRSPERRVLQTFRRRVHDEPLLGAQVERTNDVDRVLNIFARVNRGGTKLTYAEMLVSVASASWTTLDGREEINGLRSEMNRRGFNFGPERIMKASLLLLDREPKFHVDSFNRSTNRDLEANWTSVRIALLQSVDVLKSFGLDKQTLTAENALLPVAYYIYLRRFKKYAVAGTHARDRERVRSFVARTLLKRGFWTGAVDPVLVQCRSLIRQHGAGGFPLSDLAASLTGTKTIDFSQQELEELLSTAYSHRSSQLLLQLLYPDARAKERFDKDHVFPRSAFTEARLRRNGVLSARHSEWMRLSEQLPNLQLLESVDNRGGKSAQLPHDWLKSLPAPNRSTYAKQDLKLMSVPSSLSGFEAFWHARRSKMEQRLGKLLGQPRA